MRFITLIVALAFCSCKSDFKSNKLVGKWELVQSVYRDTTINREYVYKLDFGDDGFYDYNIEGKYYKHKRYQLKEDTVCLEIGKERTMSNLEIKFLTPNRISITDLSTSKNSFIFEKTTK